MRVVLDRLDVQMADRQLVPVDEVHSAEANSGHEHRQLGAYLSLEPSVHAAGAELLQTRLPEVEAGHSLEVQLSNRMLGQQMRVDSAALEDQTGQLGVLQKPAVERRAANDF